MVTAIGFLVIGLGAIAAGAGYVRKAQAMRGFQSAPGKVIARAVVPIPTGDMREGVWGEGGGHMPKVTYRFAVAGREYTHDRFAFAYRGYKHAVATRRLAAIPDDVEVWFDPENPQDAYLERHRPAFGWVLIAGGAIALVCSVGWMLTIALS